MSNYDYFLILNSAYFRFVLYRIQFQDSDILRLEIRTFQKSRFKSTNYFEIYNKGFTMNIQDSLLKLESTTLLNIRFQIRNLNYLVSSNFTKFIVRSFKIWKFGIFKIQKSEIYNLKRSRFEHCNVQIKSSSAMRIIQDSRFKLPSIHHQVSDLSDFCFMIKNFQYLKFLWRLKLST